MTPEMDPQRRRRVEEERLDPRLADWRLEPIKPLMKVGPSSESEEREEKPRVEAALERIGFPGRRIRRRRLNSEEEGSLMRFGRERVQDGVESPGGIGFGSQLGPGIGAGLKVTQSGERNICRKRNPFEERVQELGVSGNGENGMLLGDGNDGWSPRANRGGREMCQNTESLEKRRSSLSQTKLREDEVEGTGEDGCRLQAMFERMPTLLKILNFERTKPKRIIMNRKSNVTLEGGEGGVLSGSNVKRSVGERDAGGNCKSSAGAENVRGESGEKGDIGRETNAILVNTKSRKDGNKPGVDAVRDCPEDDGKMALQEAPARESAENTNNNAKNSLNGRRDANTAKNDFEDLGPVYRFEGSKAIYDHVVLTKRKSVNRKKSFDWEARRRVELNEARNRSQESVKMDFGVVGSESRIFNEPSSEQHKLVVPQNNCVNPLIWGGRGNNLRAKRGSMEIRSNIPLDGVIEDFKTGVLNLEKTKLENLENKNMNNPARNEKNKNNRNPNMSKKENPGRKMKGEGSVGREGNDEPTKESSFNTDNNANGKSSEYMAMLFANAAKNKVTLDPNVGQILAPTPMASMKRRGSGQEPNDSVDFFKIHKRKTSFGGFGTGRKGSLAERSCYDNISELGQGLHPTRIMEVNVFKDLNLNIGSQLSEASGSLFNDPQGQRKVRFGGGRMGLLKEGWGGEDWPGDMGFKSGSIKKNYFRLRKDSEILRCEHDVVKKVVEDLDMIEKELRLERERGFFGPLGGVKPAEGDILNKPNDFMCDGQIIDFKGSDFSVIKREGNIGTKRVKQWDPLKSPMSPSCGIGRTGHSKLHSRPFPKLGQATFSFGMDAKNVLNTSNPPAANASLKIMKTAKRVQNVGAVKTKKKAEMKNLESVAAKKSQNESSKKKRDAERRRRARNERERRRRAQRNREQKLLGKREAVDNSWKTTEDSGGLLTKKQRRNKHSKKHMDFWIQNESDEDKVRRRGRRHGEKESGKTVIVLKRQTGGVGLKLKQRRSSVAVGGASERSEYSMADSRDMKKNGRRSRAQGHHNKSKIHGKTLTQGNRRRAGSKPVALKAGAIPGQVNWENNVTSCRSRRETSKGLKTIQCERLIWNSRGACDESVKLKSKINKVKTYWAGTSLLVPNVFRHVCELEDEEGYLFEYLDLSRKELLVQANGQKAISQAGAPHLQRKGKKGFKKRRRNRRGQRNNNCSRKSSDLMADSLDSNSRMRNEKNSMRLGMTARQRRRAARLASEQMSMGVFSQSNVLNFENESFGQQNSDIFKTVNSRKGSQKGKDEDLSNSFAALWARKESQTLGNDFGTPQSRAQQQDNSKMGDEKSLKDTSEERKKENRQRKLGGFKKNSLLSALLNNVGHSQIDEEEDLARKFGSGLGTLKNNESGLSPNHGISKDIKTQIPHNSIFQSLISKNNASMSLKKSQLLANNFLANANSSLKLKSIANASSNALKLEIQRVNKQLQDSLKEGESASNQEMGASLTNARSKASIEAFNNKLKILNRLLDEEEQLHAKQSSRLTGNSELQNMQDLAQLKRLASFSQNISGVVDGERALTLKDLLGLQLSSPPRRGKRQCQSFSILTSSKKIRKASRRGSRPRRGTISGSSRRKSGGFALRRHFPTARKDSDMIEGLVESLLEEEEVLDLEKSEGSVVSLEEFRKRVRVEKSCVAGLAVAEN